MSVTERTTVRRPWLPDLDGYPGGNVAPKRKSNDNYAEKANKHLDYVDISFNLRSI